MPNNVPTFNQPVDNSGSVSLSNNPSPSYGMFDGSKSWSDHYLEMLQGADGSGIKLATNQFADESRKRQQALLDELQGIASGRQKSPAETELEQQVQAASAAGTSSLLGARNVGGGELRRQIDAEQSDVQRQGYTDQNVLHMQARQQAESALANFYSQQRGQDLGQANTNAQGELGARDVNDQYRTGLLSGGTQAAIGATQNAQNAALGKMGFDLQGRALNQAWWQAGTQGAAGAFDYLKNGSGKDGK